MLKMSHKTLKIVPIFKEERVDKSCCPNYVILCKLSVSQVLFSSNHPISSPIDYFSLDSNIYYIDIIITLEDYVVLPKK